MGAAATDTSGTRRDLERLDRGECQAMLRVRALCDACENRPFRAGGEEPPASNEDKERGKNREKQRDKNQEKEREKDKRKGGGKK